MTRLSDGPGRVRPLFNVEPGGKVPTPLLRSRPPRPAPRRLFESTGRGEPTLALPVAQPPLGWTEEAAPLAHADDLEEDIRNFTYPAPSRRDPHGPQGQRSEAEGDEAGHKDEGSPGAGPGSPDGAGPHLARAEQPTQPPRPPSAPVSLPDLSPPPAPPSSAEVPPEHQAALVQARGEAEAARARYEQALKELQRVQAVDLSTLENELTDLAIEVAREILLREIATDRQHVVRLVEAALRVVVSDEAATVLVSPHDLPTVEDERARLEVSRGGGLIRVSADPALHPGDCVVQVGRARVDARMSDRLERVRLALHSAATETE